MAASRGAAKPPRFEIRRDTRGEVIRIPARRSIPGAAILVIAAAAFTVPNLFALNELGGVDNAGFLIWLLFCGAVLVVILLALAWMLAGAELIRVTDGDLEIGQSVPGIIRMRRYSGREIRGLAASGPRPLDKVAAQSNLPFLTRLPWGAVRFDHQGRTIHSAQHLDEAEGRLIVDRLRRALPDSATRQDPAHRK